MEPNNRKAVSGLMSLNNPASSTAGDLGSSAFGSHSSSTDEDSGNFDNAEMAVTMSGGAVDDGDDALWTDIDVDVNTS